MPTPDPIPEQVYRDSALAYSADLPEHLKGDCAQAVFDDPAHRASFESAYRAGYGQGRDDEAAGLDMPRTWAIPDEPGPEVTAAKLANGQILDHIGEDRWQYRVSASERKRGIVGSCTNWDGMVRMGPVVDASGDPR